MLIHSTSLSAIPISARSLPAARSGRSSPIRSIRDDLGTTIVFVEQNLETILTLADRCCVMEKGRIVAAIPPGAVTSETVRRHLLL